jgi:xanthine dehydrogenase accessory factor
MTAPTWSVPETEVVQRAGERIDAEHDEQDVLATIVDVEGNAYRRPGAKMLLEADGSGVGAITAGCLEDELLKAADSIRETGRPELVTYDLMEDDEDVWGLGVGCNGVIDVLLEPLDETYEPALDAFREGRDIGVLTVIEGNGDLSRGDRAYLNAESNRLEAPDGGDDWPAALAPPAADLARSGKADLVTIETDSGLLSVFIDGIAAPAELLVFGTGHDVGPVTEFAAKNDFHVTVVGFRGGVELAERFPAADDVVSTSPRDIATALELTDRTYAVVMTHNFLDDQLTVETLLASPVQYVGLMGPNERFEEMLDAFEDDGVSFDEGTVESLYTPIGLDLGGGSPYQIAHSIVAEILAVKNDREPGHLRQRTGHIHERVDTAAEGGGPPAQ